MEKRLFPGILEDCEEVDGEEELIDLVDEAAERRGAMPLRGDGGWIVI